MSENNETPQGAIEAKDVINVATKLSKWKNYVLYAAVAIILIEGGVILWQRGTVANAETELAKNQTEMQRLRIERDLAKSNENTCKLNLDSQNKQIDKQGKDYAKLQADMKALEKKIADGDFYDKADDVRNQQTPKTCEEALDFMNRNTR